ncbi:MAG: phage tail tape measure protein [Hyphomicrobiaceae bacterium]
MADNVTEAQINVTANTTSAKAEFKRLESVGMDFGKSLTRAFSDAVTGGKKLGDVIRSLAIELSQLTLKAVFAPLQKTFINSIGDSFASLLTGSVPNAKGGTLTARPSGAMPVPFAAGGVVSAPTFFPMVGGRTGVMGERGAEAIMPLTRGPDGRLGVTAHEPAATTINFNVSAPDAESFLRSESQIAAMLSRVVSRGQRNL